MELWRGTMFSHNAIVYRSDRAVERIGFEDDGWLRYVPVRLPWTQLVQDRLPPGAAGVLLNRQHPHPDLIQTINAEESRLFQGIDGRRGVGEIIERAAGTGRAAARTFFARLWDYDQVVFDASATL
jgi:hypothetical protein